MASTYTVLLSELASEFKLDFFYRSTDFDKIHVTVDDISRPGLHLAGFFDHYEPMRVYVCGSEMCIRDSGGDGVSAKAHAGGAHHHF